MPLETQAYNYRIEQYGAGRPVKLAVGGLHGREWRVSKILASKIRAEKWRVKGKFFFAPIISDGTSYTSTLKTEFYEAEPGVKLLNLIRRVKPSIYLEIHGYSAKALKNLVNPRRLQKKGAPRFFKLRSGLLVGSISHLLLSIHSFDLPLAVEIPMKPKTQALKDAARILKIIAEAGSIEETWRKLRSLDKRRSFEEYLEKMRIWIRIFTR